jgi:hypothetical protein
MWRMRRRKRKEEKQQDISTKICTHEQALHCISEVMQFASDSNSSSLRELLYKFKNCIKKGMNTKKWKQASSMDLWKISQGVVYWKRVICSVIEH